MYTNFYQIWAAARQCNIIRDVMLTFDWFSQLSRAYYDIHVRL